VVTYKLTSASSESRVRLELRPLIAFRDYHSLTHENAAINGKVDLLEDELLGMAPYQGLPSLYLANNAAHVESTGHWYRNFEYDAERERGLNFQEDLFNACVLRFDLKRQSPARIVASTQRQRVSAAEE